MHEIKKILRIFYYIYKDYFLHSKSRFKNAHNYKKII